MPETNIPTSGLTDAQLKLSYFYVSNKLLLRKLLILLLILINAALWSYTILNFSFWALDYNRLEKQTVDLLYSPVNIQASLDVLKPQPLNISNMESFGGSDESYDLMATVENANIDWLAEFDYAFLDNATSTYHHSFALPSQRKILVALSRNAGEAKLEIKNVKWQKITNYPELKANRDIFAVTEDVFTSASKEGDPSRVSFKLSNQSSYSYWEAGVAVFLYSGGSVSAVNYLVIPQFRSGTTREIGINWTRPLPRIDSIEIIPEINFLNPNNIMPPPSY